MNKYLLKIISFLLLSLCSFNLYSQEFEVWGEVQDIYCSPIHNIAVVNSRTKEQTKTDCNGDFKIKTKIGDSLIINHEIYKNHIHKIINHERITSKLKFDKERIKTEFLRIMDSINNYPSAEARKNIVNGKSSPIYILNNEFLNGPFEKMFELKPNHVKSVKVVKSTKAQELIGIWGKGGFVIIQTTCEHKAGTN